MPGNINNAHHEIVAEFIVCEAKLCGDAPFLLFFEPVAVDTCKGPDKGGLTMIDMACRAYDDALYHGM